MFEKNDLSKSRSADRKTVSCCGAPDTTQTEIVDLRGLRCPLPVLRSRKALALAASGALVAVISDDPLSLVDIPNFVREAGHEVVETRREGRAATFVIRRA